MRGTTLILTQPCGGALLGGRAVRCDIGQTRKNSRGELHRALPLFRTIQKLSLRPHHAYSSRSTFFYSDNSYILRITGKFVKVFICYQDEMLRSREKVKFKVKGVQFCLNFRETARSDHLFVQKGFALLLLAQK